MKNREYTVWLYGSYARQDFDKFSDIDIFIAGHPDTNQVLKDLQFENRALSVSQYDWHEIEIMAGYGSLFLQHLKLEGRPLMINSAGNEYLLSLLSSLCPYKNVSRDVNAFTMCLKDVEEGIERGSTPIFELSVIATVLRHSSVLASYIIGYPKFGRIESFQFVAKSWGFSDDIINRFKRLYQFRQYEDNLASLPFEPEENDVKEWLKIAKQFIFLLTEEAYAYEKRVFTTN